MTRFANTPTCPRHPDCRLLKGKLVCFLCEDWSEAAQFVGKDQAYLFVTTGYHPKLPAGIRISSQAQWNRVCRRYGVTDDLDLTERRRRRERGVYEKACAERVTQLQQQVRRTLLGALGDSQRIVMSGR